MTWTIRTYFTAENLPNYGTYSGNRCSHVKWIESRYISQQNTIHYCFWMASCNEKGIFSINRKGLPISRIGFGFGKKQECQGKGWISHIKLHWSLTTNLFAGNGSNKEDASVVLLLHIQQWVLCHEKAAASVDCIHNKKGSGKMNRKTAKINVRKQTLVLTSYIPGEHVGWDWSCFWIG